MHRGITTFLWILVSVVCSCQSELLHEYLDIQHQRLNFNGIVLVTKNNQPLYQISTGNASQELNVKMNPAAVFKIASISKQFTAMLIALATQEGKLRLNDSLSHFFPELKDTTWRQINLHQLLSHTSGIPHNEGISDYWTLTSRLPLSKDEALAAIFAMKLLFQPGTDMKYSSPGYFLLACILEKTYKRSYSEILTEKILLPLDMKHTGVFVTGKVVPGMVSGYHSLGDSLITAPHRDYSLMRGSGDLYSNAEDLARWNSSFANQSLWNDSLQKLLFTVHTKKIPYYGYGWFIRSGKRTAWYHGGGSFGCSALSAWYPDEQMSVVILSNISVLPVAEIWNDIEKILFKESFELPGLKQTITMTTTALQTFTGRYIQGGQELHILLINDQLYAKLGNNPPFEIYPESKEKFFGKKVNVYLTFKIDAKGNVLALETTGRGQVRHFNKQ